MVPGLFLEALRKVMDGAKIDHKARILLAARVGHPYEGSGPIP